MLRGTSDGGERWPFGFGSYGVGSKLSKVSEGAGRNASDFGAVRGGWTEAGDGTMYGAA